MATTDDIRAVERLMQTLDANPHLMAAVRSRVLTRELLELPQTMARLTERVDRLTERVDRLTERVDQIAEQLAQLTERVDRLTERVDRRFNQMANDLTWLKNVGTITVTLNQASLIAEDLGLRYQRQLQGADLIDLYRNQDLTGIAPGDLRSFRRADLIIAAANAEGALHYIAVETSFTADQRDTNRAIRNAGYLTRFTGRPATPVVASVKNDRRIIPIIDSGQVFWYELDEESLLPE